MTAKKNQTEKNKDKLPREKIIYPTYDEVVKINKAVLGDQEVLGQLPESIRKEIEEMAKNFKPRDPARIPKILDVLKELWELEPDTRLGQLLLNFAFRGGDHKEKTNYLMYEQEDDVTLAALKKTLKKEKQSRKKKV